jgi:L-lactate utilization protein LutC
MIEEKRFSQENASTTMSTLVHNPLEATLRFRLSGPAITNTFPLRDVSKILFSLDGLLENAYFTLAEDAGIPLRLAKRQVRVTSLYPEKGSIIFPVSVQLMLATALSAGITPGDVLKTGREALDLFMKISTMFKKDKDNKTAPAIQFTVSGNNNTVNIFQSDTAVTASKQAALTMAKSYSHLKTLARDLSEEAVEQVELEGADRLQISSAVRAKLLSFPKSLRDELVARLGESSADDFFAIGAASSVPNKAEEVTGSGDIISFNKENRTGIIQLLSSDKLPPGEYDFEIQSREASTSFIMAMLQSRVRIRFILRTAHKHPFLSITWVEKELGAGV